MKRLSIICLALTSLIVLAACSSTQSGGSVPAEAKESTASPENAAVPEIENSGTEETVPEKETTETLKILILTS